MTQQDIKVLPPEDIPTAEGYVGNLTDVQHDALVKMWESYFDICDRARGSASKGSGFKEDTIGKDPKKSGIPEDDAAKDEVKKQQEQQGMSELLEQYGPEALRDSWWNFVRGDNPDGNMLRFIRARKGDVDRGLAMMATCLKWRLDTDVEKLIASGDLINGKEIPKFTEQQKSGKVFSLGTTSKEQPICYVIMKYHSIWGQPAASMQKFIVSQMETFRLLMHPPNDKATIFFDLKGFGVKQMDFVNLLYLVKVLESYYPESLGTMYVSNAPLIFWGFWKAVKNLLDPVVRNKIVFISTPEDTNGDVPADQMIEYCGGTVTNKFDYVEPKEGENDPQNNSDVKEKLLARHHKITDRFEAVTREWCKTGGKDEKLQEERQILTKKLRLSQFELEPYTRGLSVYHRNGVIPAGNQGISVFDYQRKDDETVRQILGRKTCRKSIERELYEIVKEKSTTKAAEEKTSKSLQDGTFGSWEVNDNSDEIKRVALATLEDTENTGDINPTQAPANGGSQALAAAQVGKEDEVKAQAEASQQDTSASQEQNDSAEPSNADKGEVAGAGAGAAAGGAAAATAATNGKVNGDTQTPATNAEGMRRAASGTSTKAKAGPDPTATTNYKQEGPPEKDRRKSIIGSIKAKMGKVSA